MSDDLTGSRVGTHDQNKGRRFWEKGTNEFVTRAGI